MNMSLSVLNVTSTAQELIAAAQRSWLVVQNASDSDVFYKFTSDSTALTVANGLKLVPDETIVLHTNNAVSFIHNTAGNKSIRVHEEPALSS